MANSQRVKAFKNLFCSLSTQTATQSLPYLAIEVRMNTVDLVQSSTLSISRLNMMYIHCLCERTLTCPSQLQPTLQQQDPSSTLSISTSYSPSIHYVLLTLPESFF